ncbi:choice-of-anchor tandem repeat GloVer-containing protein [Paraflavitalea speifideaquila]|uniref:choice-of-anchor tandem repeat GloVer-containing protein n=1 Tax=Paraflavitalea speifideaquila TaxID=3076558 RepID=UPI0028E6F131|nr:choice-of-anchor tandem repeat GloVer-containing protein [Paraflavitalea speifideiaquila]
MVIHNGLLYGIVEGGGITKAVLFEYNPMSNALAIKHIFQGTTGYVPDANITVAFDKIYGTTFNGGVDAGVIYSFDLETNVFSKLAEFPHAMGYYRNGALLEYQHKLYGTTVAGGTLNDGILFSFDLNTNTLNKIADMASIGAAEASGGMVRFFNNGTKFYGGTREGGANNGGVIYEYDPLANKLTKKIDLSATMGTFINGAMVVYDQKLYGLARSGASMSQGTLFRYDPVLNQYQPRLIFQREFSGAYPVGTLCLYNDKLYGLPNEGGANNQGALIEYDPDVNGYHRRVDLGSSNGFRPEGKLTYYSGKLYGVTSSGGNFNKGVIYSYDIATHTYAIRYHMTTATGNVDDEGV